MTNKNLIQEVGLLIESLTPSPLLSGDVSRSATLFAPTAPGAEYRALTSSEIAALERSGSTCSNWSLLLVAEDFQPASVQRCRFHGKVRIGFQNAEVEIRTDRGVFREGIRDSSLRNTDIGPHSVIESCGRIESTQIGHECIVVNSNIVHVGTSTFGNGIWMKAGNEAGGRLLPIFPEMNCKLAAFLCENLRDKELETWLRHYIGTWTHKLQRDWSQLCPGVRVFDTPAMKNVILCENATVDGAQRVEDCSVLSEQTARTYIGPGAIVQESSIGEGCTVTNGAQVLRSQLMEFVEVDSSALVKESLLAPNCAMARGEVHASYVGPFTAAHHQSLLISATWTGGRGNVSYGANVGSNHTSRIGDQEIVPGEGLFFGLGCLVKFPANFSESPFSLIAAGITTPPQRLRFPFSLITENQVRTSERHSALNQLIPAWYLTENYYALYRSEKKHAERNRARRSVFDLAIFRPEIFPLLESAILRLEHPHEIKELYGPFDIEGIGKNCMWEHDRLKALEAYRFFLSLGRLREQRNELRLARDRGCPPGFDPLPVVDGLAAALPRLRALVRVGKDRDSARGRSIIDDYEHTHPDADHDQIIAALEKELHEELAELDLLRGSFA